MLTRAATLSWNSLSFTYGRSLLMPYASHAALVASNMAMSAQVSCCRESHAWDVSALLQPLIRRGDCPAL
jgi:hypothetical protein